MTHFVESLPVERIEHINGKSLKLTNLNKLYWPAEGISKGALIDYYHQIASTILPYLKGRPQALHRFPDGISGKHFFQKDIKDAPDWLDTLILQSESQKGEIRYLLCQDEASLIYIVNLGAIEINIWNSTTAHLHHPDYMVIDLDPLNCPFKDVIKTSLGVHEILQQIQMPHYVKTSGATGLHIFVPLNAQYTYEQTRQFSLIICTIVNKTHPDITSLERLPERRNGKVYLDFLQNSFGKTMTAPYSVRPRPLCPVSTPLFWEELTCGIEPQLFTINTIPERLNHHGDLWKAVIGEGVNISLFLPLLQDIYTNL
jgi:bifunctional non-homologous end joining protein LigD